jgi:phosphatidylserine/phosphatidylglycerophosphate/cardiolipin synthase-like enzyme
MSIYSRFLPLQEGVNIAGEIHSISEEDIEFLFDATYLNKEGQVIIEQEIFDNIFEVVDNANEFIIIDMFLFNTDYSEKVKFKNLTRDLKDKLIEKKKQNPEIDIVFITDEINNFYGSYTSDEISELENNNIPVVITDLTKLRDVNPIYAGLWRSYLRWFNTEGEGYLKHPLGNLNKKVTFTAYLRLMNVKANHRKVITADENGETVSIITSANPHEASSKHGNVAIRIKNSIAKDILKSEKEIAKFSGHDFDIENKLKLVKNTEGNIDVQLLTERQIRDSLVKEINNLNEGESIEMVMFYLSDRIVVNSLLEASERGVNIRIILDPNKDAFAKEKNGIPNRQVAYELFKESKGKIEVRWYNTQGEQQHTKLIVIRKHNETIIFLGSSNLTKRNIGNFNLEANIKIITPKETEIDLEIREFFYKFWNNLDGEYTLNFDNYKEDSFPKYQLYIFQESTGLSSF